MCGEVNSIIYLHCVVHGLRGPLHEAELVLQLLVSPVAVVRANRVLPPLAAGHGRGGTALLLLF